MGVKSRAEGWPLPSSRWLCGRRSTPCILHPHPVPDGSDRLGRVPAVNNPERPSSGGQSVIMPVDVTHSQQSGGLRKNLLVPQTAF